MDAKGIEIKEKLSTLHEEESDLLSKEGLYLCLKL